MLTDGLATSEHLLSSESLHISSYTNADGAKYSMAGKAVGP